MQYKMKSFSQFLAENEKYAHIAETVGLMKVGDSVEILPHEDVEENLHGETGQITGLIGGLYVVQLDNVDEVDGYNIEVPEEALQVIDTIAEGVKHKIQDSVKKMKKMGYSVHYKKGDYIVKRDGEQVLVFDDKEDLADMNTAAMKNRVDTEDQILYTLDAYYTFDRNGDLIDESEDGLYEGKNKMNKEIVKVSKALRKKGYSVDISVGVISVEYKGGEGPYFAQGDDADEMREEAEAAADKFGVTEEDYILYALDSSGTIDEFENTL